MSPGPFPRLVSASQYAEKWHRSKATIIRWCKTGVLERCQYVGDYMWVIDANEAPKNRFLGPRELKLLNEMSPEVDPITAQPRRQYPHVAPNPGRRKGYKVPSLETLRVEFGLSQRELERLSGVGRHVIMRGERGGRLIARNIRKLAIALDVEVADLLYTPEKKID